jgi:hypothetical protein
MFVDEPAVGLSLLNGVEVFALDVLDERDLKQLFVGDVTDDDRDAKKAGALGRTPSAFARDDFVLPVNTPHENRLDDPVGPDALREFLQAVFLDERARLTRIRDEQVDVELEGPSLGVRGAAGGAHVPAFPTV